MAARKRRKKRKSFKFLKYMQKKLIVVFLLVFVLLGGLIFRLMYIQRTSGDRYEKIVLNQQSYDSSTIPFRRGDILDSKGTILATSQDVYNLIIDCKVIHEDKKYLEPTVSAVTRCFPDVTEEELRSLLEERKDSPYCVLRKKLPYEEIHDFVELTEEVYTEGENKGKKVNPNVKGVWFEKEYKRVYPYDTLASKVLGFTTSGNAGIGGLEGYYNETLNGINGRNYGYLNSDKSLERTIKEAANGNSIVTTIDMNVQSIVEQKIAEFNESYRDAFTDGPGSLNTAVLVMNPNNGEILAMADSTGYSLNNPRDEAIFNQYCTDYRQMTPEDIQALDEDARLEILNAIWQNFCITYTFEPGSTVKPLTVAAGLDSGKMDGTEMYFCDGGEWVGEHHINCVVTTGHGTETVEQAVMNSCNDALMAMSQQIGIDTFAKYQNIFNIGLKTNIDLPGEARTDTLIHTAESMRRDAAALATNSFGQNFNTTMVQVATAIASVINGGYYYQPHMVKKIVDENGGTVKTIEPTVLKQVISNETSDMVRGYMVSTVAAGTGASAKVPGYSMGGKTGTAEKLPRKNEKFLVSFIGFAPAENPEVLVYVVINEPNAENQAKSTFATALAKEIMAEIFPYLNIYPDEPIPEEGSEPSGEGAPGEGQEPEGGSEPFGEGQEPEGGPEPSGEGAPGEGQEPEGGSEPSGEGAPGEEQEPGEEGVPGDTDPPPQGPPDEIHEGDIFG